MYGNIGKIKIFHIFCNDDFTAGIDGRIILQSVFKIKYAFILDRVTNSECIRVTDMQPLGHQNDLLTGNFIARLLT